MAILTTYYTLFYDKMGIYLIYMVSVTISPPSGKADRRIHPFEMDPSTVARITVS